MPSDDEEDFEGIEEYDTWSEGLTMGIEYPEMDEDRWTDHDELEDTNH